MAGLGALEILLLIVFVGIIPAMLGRRIATRLREDQRTIMGSVAAIIGVILIVFGTVRLSSVTTREPAPFNDIRDSQRRLTEYNRPDIGGMLSLGFGVVIGITGIVVIFSKSSKVVDK